MPSVTLKSGRQLEIDVECEEASGDGFHEPRHAASVGVVAVWERVFRCPECNRESQSELLCHGFFDPVPTVRRPADTTPDEDQEIMQLVEQMEREYDDRD